MRGDPNTWDTSKVTDMSSLFLVDGPNSSRSLFIDFNEPLGAWHATNVTNMQCMFHGAAAFNQNLASWDCSNVTDMNAMFNEADHFNQPIETWDTSKVTTMEEMFKQAWEFKQSLAAWSVESVTNADQMFKLTQFSKNGGSIPHGWTLEKSRFSKDTLCVD